MEKINDLEIYNARMAKSMYDKLWFVDKLPDDISMLYDYGCGDGTLLQMAQPFLPVSCIRFGYDNNPDMITRAIKKGIPMLTHEPMKQVPAGTCLVASSVFHEIYNYSDDIETERQNIFGIGADYIAIRDMYYSGSNGRMRSSIVQKVRQVFYHENSYLLDQFEEKYGWINTEKNFAHFLLKYQYTENWNKELNENYFPYSISGILSDEYSIAYLETYTLPFLKEQIKKDFGIDFNIPTHIKMLLKRVK